MVNVATAAARHHKIVSAHPGQDLLITVVVAGCVPQGPDHSRVKAARNRAVLNCLSQFRIGFLQAFDDKLDQLPGGIPAAFDTGHYLGQRFWKWHVRLIPIPEAGDGFDQVAISLIAKCLFETRHVAAGQHKDELRRASLQVETMDPQESIANPTLQLGRPATVPRIQKDDDGSFLADVFEIGKEGFHTIPPGQQFLGGSECRRARRIYDRGLGIHVRNLPRKGIILSRDRSSLHFYRALNWRRAGEVAKNRFLPLC